MSINPVDRARADAMKPFDPKRFLEHCNKIGLDVELWRDGLVIWYNDSNPERRLYLECLLNLVPGGHRAVTDLLKSSQPAAKAP